MAGAALRFDEISARPLEPGGGGDYLMLWDWSQEGQNMHIQVNTDNHIHGDDRLAEVVEEVVAGALNPVAKRITRVEVHIKDVNGPKGGEDIHAIVEARPEGMRPYAAQEQGTDIRATVKTAAETLRRRLESEFGKRDERR